MTSALIRIAPRFLLASMIGTIVLISASGCDKVARAKEPGRYYDFWAGFSIKFPVEWEQKEDFMGSEVVALSPAVGSKDLFRENVSVMIGRLPRAMNLQEFVDFHKADLKQQLQGVKIYKEQDVTLGGESAHSIIIGYKLAGMKFKMTIYSVVKGQMGYNVVCTASTKSHRKYQKQFEDIASTFHFE